MKNPLPRIVLAGCTGYIGRELAKILLDSGYSIICPVRNIENATKYISNEEYFLQGHFPNNPIFPGVIIIEALGQASGILGFVSMNKTPEQGSIYVLAGVDKVRFRKRVRPGDNIDLYSKVISEKRGIWKFECRAELDGELICTATILCADRKAE